MLFFILTCCVSQAEAQLRKNRKQKVIYDWCGPIVVGIETYSVSVLIQHYYPYCGGAAPDESQLNNVLPQSSTQFILYNFDTKEEQVVVTDSTGHLNVKLAEGRYGIKEMYKHCTFKEFKEKYPPVQDEYMISQDEECYKNWWSSYLFEFTVHPGGTDPLNPGATISEVCFTGINPCIQYVGPWPP